MSIYEGFFEKAKRRIGETVRAKWEEHKAYDKAYNNEFKAHKMIALKKKARRDAMASTMRSEPMITLYPPVPRRVRRKRRRH